MQNRARLDKYCLADDLLIKPILTREGFDSVFSKFQNLEIKFYWLTNYITQLNKLVNFPHLLNKQKFISDKILSKVINGVVIPNDYINYEKEYLSERQVKLITYLNTDLIPYVNNAYDKLIEIMREETQKSDFDKGFYDENLVTFNYNSVAISGFLSRVVIIPYKQAIYLRKLLIKISVDLNNNVISDDLLNKIINAELPRLEQMTEIVRIRLCNETAEIVENSDYKIINDASEENNIEKPAESITDYTITDKHKLVCLGTETKLKKLYQLLINFDVIEGDIENINYDDFLSLCLKKDKSNYVTNAVPRKIRLKDDQLLIAYIIGNLINSFGNHKYLFDGANVWNKLKNLFLSKEGLKLNSRSMSKQFSKIKNGKNSFYRKDIMDMIINMVRAFS